MSERAAVDATPVFFARRQAWHLRGMLFLLLAACTTKSPDSGGSTDSPDSGTDGCPVASIATTGLTWSDVAPGTGADQTVSLGNACSGVSSLDVSGTVDGATFVVDAASWSIAPGDLARVTVTYTPDDGTADGGTLLFTTNDPDRPEIAVTLSGVPIADQDGDGYIAGEDCDDSDSRVNPAATEIWYDGIDQNCDGNDDDQDGDGVAVDADCADTDAAIHPGAAETWYDGIDQDCSGGDDFDQDGDGWEIGADCADADPAIHPDAVEAWYDGVDQDCAGDDDFDRDGDGVDLAEDCNDGDPTVNPQADEVWYDGVDQDCDGNDRDQDGDGFDIDDDCDDTNGTVFPGAVETWYDGVDQDCSGGDDYDQDGDGVDVYPTGADCADTDPGTTGGTTEVRNGIDDDCDGQVDEGLVVAGDVLVTEYMADPTYVADTYGEWLELTNVSGADVDLSGWVVEGDDGNSFTITSLVIPAGDSAAFGPSGDPTLNGGYTPDYVYDRATFSLADLTDTIRVRAGGVTISEYHYSEVWPQAHVAVQLDVGYQSAAYASDASYWCAATTYMNTSDRGTPGEANGYCTNLDHDGDGVTLDGYDCDDQNPARSPDNAELADTRVDEDCDGIVDETAPPGGPYLDGMTTSAFLAPRSIGDFADDGSADLMVISDTSDLVRFVDGDAFRSWAGPITDYAYADLTLPATTSIYGWSIWESRAGDVTGDGATDLVGSRYDWSSPRYIAYAYVWEGPFTGSTPRGTEVATVADGGGAQAANPAVEAHTDYDGDGLADLVVANAVSNRAGDDAGAVGVFRGGTFAGRLGMGDADWCFTGTQYLGYELDSADVDGDGYADLAVGEANAVHLIGGLGARAAGEWVVGDVATLTVESPDSYALTATLFDSEGDGDTDLYFGWGDVYGVKDVGSRTGTLTVADADAHVAMDYSAYAAGRPSRRHVDFDADGVLDLPVYVYDGMYGQGSMVWFDGATLNGEVDPADALAAWQFTPQDGFQGPSADLDGDGRVEITFATPYSSEGGASVGRVWVWEP